MPDYTLYTAATPNGWKASITLEELGVDYRVVPVDLSKGEQKRPGFVALNPNGRIPALVDHSAGDFVVFESGALMLYLAQKHGQLIPSDPQGASVVTQWLMWQMGGLGPMMGQANVFFRYAPEKLPWAIERYQRESRRLLEVMDARLQQVPWLGGEHYSIADIACWSWTHTARWSGVDNSGLPGLKDWHDRIKVRPAVRRGKDVPGDAPLRSPEDEARFIERAQDMLV
ncbi:MAG: glutathione S-transferase N-terminal domain-containing protein [Myxococcota bacterium]|nr:glutathione S-transferase N-terminal domain-containing protein [Myxococcota bacterium]